MDETHPDPSVRERLNAGAAREPRRPREPELRTAAHEPPADEAFERQRAEAERMVRAQIAISGQRERDLDAIVQSQRHKHGD